MAEITTGTTLYDANKQIMANEKFTPLNHLELAAAQLQLENFFNWQCDTYAMLYCRELSDITIFHMYETQNPNPPAIAAKECIGCCLDRGLVLSIEKQEDGNYEIWIRVDGEPHAYYLFPYDRAVIEC